jgi:hypothetical protein
VFTRVLGAGALVDKVLRFIATDLASPIRSQEAPGRGWSRFSRRHILPVKRIREIDCHLFVQYRLPWAESLV